MVQLIGTILTIYAVTGFILYIIGYMDRPTQRDQWQKDHPGMKWEDWHRR